ncbi:hypothetical protein HYT25_03945 [Candidatus Pacearchaeota archaeon]|nr:hypothetical protein [Candidatus Pacearchaeota archaeon]
MPLLKDKIGADKILSIYWFAILFIISIGIFSMVYVFYKTPFDVRGMESGILTSKIAECVSQQGKLDSKWLQDLEDKNSNSLSDIINYANQNQVNGKTCYCGDDCNDYAKYISSSASNNEIKDPLFLFSLIMQESQCRKIECSDSSCGLTQINLKKHCGTKGLPSDLEECKDVLINDIEKSIEVGSEILKESYDTYNDGKTFSDACTSEYKTKTYFGWDAALRGYNGWGCDQKYPQQDKYVDDVNGVYNSLKNLFGAETSEKSEIVEECNLNFNSEFEDEQFYIQVDFYNLAAFETQNIEGRSVILSEPSATIFDGNQNLKADCEIQKEKDFEKQSKCSEGRFYSVDENNLPYVVRILTAVRKTEKNVI